MKDDASSRARGFHLALLIILCVPVLLVTAATLYDHLPAALQGALDFLTFCPYRAYKGEACPLCGGTSALSALLSGDWSAARSFNVNAVFAAPGMVVEFVYRLVRVYRPLFSLQEELLALVVSSALGLVFLLL